MDTLDIISPAEAPGETEDTHQPQSPLVVAGATDQGRRRENNEDKLLIADDHDLYVVCDGMGGMAMGELASSYAVGAIEKWFEENEAQVQKSRVQGAEAVQERLTQALVHANQVIERMVEEKPHWQGMGTTVVLGYRVGTRLHLANVGDSRAYLIRAGTIRSLTTDDTIAAALLRRDEMSEAEARSSPLRNQLTSSLGGLSRKGPHHATLELQSADRVILCSDGLWDMASDEEIQALTEAANDPKAAVSALIDKANENGGHDNITVIALFAATLPESEHPENPRLDEQEKVSAPLVVTEAAEAAADEDLFRTRPQMPASSESAPKARRIWSHFLFRKKRASK
jgi:PPM family protein phosphatase